MGAVVKGVKQRKISRFFTTKNLTFFVVKPTKRLAVFVSCLCGSFGFLVWVLFFVFVGPWPKQ